MFYTRIPCPAWVDHSEDYLNASTRYFPLMGWIVGGVAGAVFWISNLAFPQELAVLFSILASIWITGAFHEDGFADVCDGFGGGWSKMKILEIMKDSRLGTYGVVGVMLMFAFKFFALSLMPVNLIPLILISGHSLSRWMSTSIIFLGTYAREDELSKVKPIGKKMNGGSFLLSSVFGVAPLFLLQNFWILLAVPLLLLIRWRMYRFFKKWIGGYTGDCLGAVQQLTEVIYYLFILAEPWKYI
jgi:adenosylcobinamide-GDP ribazoletransferase